MSYRFYGDLMPDTKPGEEKYCVKDRFSEKIVHTNLDAEGAESCSDRLNRQYDEARIVAGVVARFVNGMGSADNFVTAMGGEHRTLQQGFTVLVVAWIEYLAKLPDYQYDARNMASVQLAKQLVQTPGWDRLKYLPHI